MAQAALGKSAPGSPGKVAAPQNNEENLGQSNLGSDHDFTPGDDAVFSDTEHQAPPAKKAKNDNSSTGAQFCPDEEASGGEPDVEGLDFHADRDEEDVMFDEEQNTLEEGEFDAAKEEDSDGSSGDESNSSSEDSETHHSKSSTSNAVSEPTSLSLFDPLKSVKEKQWSLPTHMGDFVEQYFTQWVDEAVVRKEILEANPVPAHDRVRTLKLEADMINLLPPRSRPGATKQDHNAKRCQDKIIDVLGPLSKAWSIVDKRKRKQSDVNLAELIEKSVFLLGQAFVMTNYFRRTAILSRFLGKEKEAATLTRKNGELLAKNKTSLFGSTFYKALYKRAKGTKQLNEIRRELGHKPNQGFKPKTAPTPRPQPKQRKRDYNSGYNSGNRGQQQSQPFPRGPPHQQRSGGGNYQKKGKHRKDRYVCSTSSLSSTKFGGNAGFDTHSKGSHSHRGDKPKSGHTPAYSSTYCGQGSRLLVKLVKVDRRPSSPRQCQGSHARPSATTVPKQATILAKDGQNRAGSNGQRDSHSLVKGGNRTGSTGQYSVPKPPISQREERRIVPSHHKPQRSKPVCSLPPFQNGGYPHVNSTSSKKRLVHKSRPKGCILLHSHCKRTQEVSQVHVGGEHIPIQSSSLRSGVSPQNIHKAAETSSQLTKTTGNKTPNIPGRPDCAKSKQEPPGKGQGHTYLVAASSGSGDKLSQISPNTNPNNRVLRVPVTHKLPDPVTSNGEVEGNPSGMQGYAEPEDHDSASVGPADGETQCNNPGSAPSTTAPPLSSDAPDKGALKGQSDLRISSQPNTSMQGGAPLVVNTAGGVERQVPHVPLPGPNHNHRCLKEGLGGGVQPLNSPGVMESGGGTGTHQCARTQGSRVGAEVFHKELSRGSCTPEAGQQHSCSPDNKDGHNQVDSPIGGNQTDVALRTAERDHPYCRTSTRRKECHRRLSESGISGLQQLDPGQISVPTDSESLGTTRSGSFCGQTQSPAKKLHELEARSGFHPDRCLPDKLAEPEGVCIPPILSNRPQSSKDPERQSNSSLDNPNLAEPSVVSNTAGDVNSSPNTTSIHGKSPDKSQRRDSSSTRKPNPPASGLDGFRSKLLREGFSRGSAELLLQSWRPGTQSTYNTPWNKWSSWCEERSINPFSTTVANIGNFLAELFDQGLEYRTLNVYRSAVSAFHVNIDNTPIGSHPLIKKLMTGVFNQKPPKPRYTGTWDVNKVLRQISNMGENETLCLKDLTLKTSMLLAITTACRGSELQKLNPMFISWQGNEMGITIDKVTKTSRPNKPHVQITLKQYPLDTKLDVVGAVQTYLERTEELRTSVRQKSHLLLSFTKPHNPVAPCSIGRWLKTIMEMAGVDTSVFKAHSTRSASTSKAKAQGLSVEQIVNRAHWSTAATFYRFYHKDVITDDTASFEETVLQM